MALNDEIKKIRDKLDDHEKRIKSLEENSPRQVVTPENPTNVDSLATRLGASAERLRELFSIKGNTLTLCRTVGDNDIERTRYTSLLVLLGYKYSFDVEDVSARELRRNVSQNGIPLDNFATSLDDIIPSLILRKGKPKSTKTSYRLTNPGETRAIEILRTLCG